MKRSRAEQGGTELKTLIQNSTSNDIYYTSSFSSLKITLGLIKFYFSRQTPFEDEDADQLFWSGELPSINFFFRSFWYNSSNLKKVKINEQNGKKHNYSI